MKNVKIVTENGKRSRTFEAVCLGTVTSRRLVDPSNGHVDRPCWAVFTAPEQQLRAFMANVRLGRRIEAPHWRAKGGPAMEFLKTGGFAMTWQTEEEGSIATIYADELFRLDPGMVDPEGIRFIMMPPSAWLDAQDIRTGPAIRDAKAVFGKDIDARFVKQAALFAAYLDRRTRAPIINDTIFQTRLLLRLMKSGSARHANAQYGFETNRYGRDIEFYQVDKLGYAAPIDFVCSHDEFERVMAEVTAEFYGTGPTQRMATHG